MSTPDVDFENELETFRHEAEGCTQYFYSYLAVHAVARDARSVYQVLNQAPLFWNTTLSALQAATFIVLGRIFDQRSPHNIDRALGIAQRNPEIFFRSALGARRQGRSETRPDWLEEYVRRVYEPTAADFRRLRAHVQKRRKIYEANYRDLRHKIFAHKALTDQVAIAALFAKTNIRELQHMLVFLNSLHDALWQLYFNGRKPALRPRRYSVKRIRDLPSPDWKRKGVQERITHEAEAFLKGCVGVAQRLAAPRGNSRIRRPLPQSERDH
jgi:AbiU2